MGNTTSAEIAVTELCQRGAGGGIRTHVGARPAVLQTAPIDHSGTPALRFTQGKLNSSPLFNDVYTDSDVNRRKWSRLSDSNRGPTVYKTVALATELRRLI